MHTFLLHPGAALKVFVHYQENLTFGVSQGKTEFDRAVMNILFSSFLPLFFPLFSFPHLWYSQERNFWTINLIYTHTCFHFLTVSCVIFIFCHGNTWKIFMPSGHTERVLSCFHPVLRWRGYDLQSQSCAYVFALTACPGRSTCVILKMSTGGKETESTCSCLNGYSVLRNVLLYDFQSLKEFFSLGWL